MSKKEQIIFLDVDGVLTSRRCNGYYDFDLWAVSFLRWACMQSGAKIVMSSAWRMIPEAKEWFTQVFGEHLHTDWRTGNLDHRGDEINEWLEFHPEITKFVILDDDLWGLEDHQKNLVHTTIENGMLYEHMKATMGHLGIAGELPRLQPIFNDPVCFYTTREKRKLEVKDWIKELQDRNGRKLSEESNPKINFTK